MRDRRMGYGFTLMELLVVLVIIGLLAALVGPILFQRINPAKRTIAHSQMQEFMTALDNYYIDTGHYPTTEQGLAALRRPPEGMTHWHGPYLKKDIPDDPWGDPYVYRSPGRNGGYEIISFGADGKAGGRGADRDIDSWKDSHSR